MDLLAFEHDRGFVVKALRQGEIDHLEPVTEAVEADFFRHLIDRQLLKAERTFEPGDGWTNHYEVTHEARAMLDGAQPWDWERG